MGVNMSENLMPFSIIFLGISIVIGSWLISQTLKLQCKEAIIKQDNKFRYELVSPNESNILLFDKQSGDY
jgi:hypothetical protein